MYDELINCQLFEQNAIKKFQKSVTDNTKNYIVKPGQVFVITIQTSVGILSTKCAIILPLREILRAGSNSFVIIHKILI